MDAPQFPLKTAFAFPTWLTNVKFLALRCKMVTVDMVPDRAGMWMYHCHVSDHMMAGMMAHYEVTDPSTPTHAAGMGMGH